MSPWPYWPLHFSLLLLLALGDCMRKRVVGLRGWHLSLLTADLMSPTQSFGAGWLMDSWPVTTTTLAALVRCAYHKKLHVMSLPTPLTVSRLMFCLSADPKTCRLRCLTSDVVPQGNTPISARLYAPPTVSRSGTTVPPKCLISLLCQATPVRLTRRLITTLGRSVQHGQVPLSTPGEHHSHQTPQGQLTDRCKRYGGGGSPANALCIGHLNHAPGY